MNEMTKRRRDEEESCFWLLLILSRKAALRTTTREWQSGLCTTLLGDEGALNVISTIDRVVLKLHNQEAQLIGKCSRIEQHHRLTRSSISSNNHSVIK